jgi:hypothetical protein
MTKLAKKNQQKITGDQPWICFNPDSLRLLTARLGFPPLAPTLVLQLTARQLNLMFTAHTYQASPKRMPTAASFINNMCLRNKS